MFNIVLLLILVLHAAPFGLKLTNYANYDIFILTNLIIQVILAGCVRVCMISEWKKILSSLVLVASIGFLCNYIVKEATPPVEESFVILPEDNSYIRISDDPTE